MSGLIWLLVYAGFFYLMMRYGCGAHMVHGHAGHAGAREGASKDPVCGVTVDAGQGYTKIHEGTRLHFCSRTCLDKFEAEPRPYLP